MRSPREPREPEERQRESDSDHPSPEGDGGEGQFRILWEIAPIGMAYLGPDGRFLLANPAFCRMLGYTSEELSGYPFIDLTHPDDKDDNLRRFRAMVAGDQPGYQMEKRYIRKDGTVIWVDIRVASIRSPTEGARGFLAMAADISGRKEAEEASRIAEEKYRRIFNLSPNPVGVTRVSDGLFVEVNDAYTESLGYSREEVIGRTLSELGVISPLERREFLDLLREKGRLKLMESEVHRTDTGETRPVLLSAEFLEFEGEPHVLWEAVDISERRLLEAQLRQAQKLETLGTLAGGIAHDFNNLLVPILGYAELLESGVPGDHPLRQEMERHLLDAALRARELVQQILTFSRRDEPVRTVIPMGQPVKRALRLVEATLPASIKLSSQIQGSDGMILADETQIEQMVLNLCTNASHAMRESGGVLEVSLENVDDLTALKERNPEFQGSGAVLLTVRDTGQGIPHEHMERIFDPFFTTKGQDHGTGLGLSIVYGVVKSHGGDIAVESETDSGTLFRVWLPLSEEESQDLQLAVEAELRGEEEILVVDDREPTRETIRRLLEPLGYGVTLAASGVQALNLFQEDPSGLDLGIIDYDMPGMTGTHLALELLELRPEFPIVLITGGDPGRIADAERLGIRGTLRKPFTARELCSAVRNALGDI